MSRFDGRPADLISSRRNPLVQQVRALQQPRGRREQGLLLLEGTHLLQECRRLLIRSAGRPSNLLKAAQVNVVLHHDAFRAEV